MICCLLKPNLYPTVGLQTPGEIIEANFGQSPFVFNIGDYVKVRQHPTAVKTLMLKEGLINQSAFLCIYHPVSILEVKTVHALKKQLKFCVL